MQGLTTKLAQWSGKSTDELEALYNQYQDTPELVQFLLQALHDSRTQAPASWLLKRHVQACGLLLPVQMDKLGPQLQGLQHWSSRLHILQLLPGHTVTQRHHWEPFIRQMLADKNTFVRAWAYNALHELALQFPELKSDARDIIASAQRDEAPSVKARLRHLTPETPTQ